MPKSAINVEIKINHVGRIQTMTNFYQIYSSISIRLFGYCQKKPDPFQNTEITDFKDEIFQIFSVLRFQPNHSMKKSVLFKKHCISYTVYVIHVSVFYDLFKVLKEAMLELRFSLGF